MVDLLGWAGGREWWSGGEEGRSALLLEVTAELVAHRREELVPVLGLAAGGEPIVEGGTQHGGGDAFLDGGLERPATLAGVGDPATEVGEVVIFVEGLGGEVEQPGPDHGTAPPDLGDVGEIQFVLVVLGI